MNNQKICTFYISEFHLLTILLPYINGKLLEEKEIAVILQNDISGNVKTYLKNVRNLNLDNEKIINIGWNKSSEKELENDLNGKYIIVVGSKEYIEKVNSKIIQNFTTEEILNCYKVNEIERIDEILMNHSKVLNTRGKRDVKKFSQNAQKSKTIRTQI